jgi:aminopeptidase N
MPLERQDGCISIFALRPPLRTYLCAWTFDAFECVRRTTSHGVPIEFYVRKESANVDHIPKLADAELKIVKFDESWCLPSLPPDRLQAAVVSRFHFSSMDNCGLVIVSDSSLASRLPTMR